MGSKIAGKILDVAVECFALNGYHGTTTKAICDRANVTEGSLFRLFTSKEKIFEAALREELERGRPSTASLADIMEADENFERGLTKAMLACFQNMSDRYVRLSVFALLEHPEIARAYFTGPSHSITRTIARTIEREIYRGKLRDDVEPMVAAAQLVASLFQTTLVAPILTDLKLTSKTAKRETVEKYVEIWFRGMQIQKEKTSKKRRRV